MLFFEKKTQFLAKFNLIKISSTHLLPIFYSFFLVARAHERTKKTIENREQVCRANFN